MNLTTMYEGMVNSPQTTISTAITASDTTITVSDVSKIPDAPNLLVIGGASESPETVLLTGISGSDLTVTRAFQGTAQDWDADTLIGRNFTEYDFSTFKDNIEALNENKADANSLFVVSNFSEFKNALENTDYDNKFILTAGNIEMSSDESINMQNSNNVLNDIILSLLSNDLTLTISSPAMSYSKLIIYKNVMEIASLSGSPYNFTITQTNQRSSFITVQTLYLEALTLTVNKNASSTSFFRYANDISSLSSISGTGMSQLSYNPMEEVLGKLNNYISKDNTTAFTPDADYEPATKKYVDNNDYNISSGTADPSGGSDGDIYLQYE